MSSDISELRRLRGVEKGRITNIRQAVLKLKGKTLAEYDNATLDRYNEKIPVIEASFMKHHTRLCEVDTTTEQSKHDADMEEMHSAVGDIKQMDRYMRTCESARSLGQKLVVNLQDLNSDLEVDGYTGDMNSQYLILESDVLKFRNLIALYEVYGKDEIGEIRHAVNRLWSKAKHARNDSGYEPPKASEKRHSKSSKSSKSTWDRDEDDDDGDEDEDDDDSYKGRRSSSIKVDPPTFYGSIVQFPDFKKLFIDVLKGQKLTPYEKKTVLLKSMGTKETKEQVRIALKKAKTFKEALEKLSLRYEKGRDVVAFHLRELIHNPQVEYNHEGTQRVLKLLNDNAAGLELAECLTADQVVVSILDSQFSPELQKLWRTKTESIKGIPTIEDLREYMESLERIMAPTSIVGAPDQPMRQPNKKRQPPRQRNRKFKEESPPPSKPATIKQEEFEPPKQVFQTSKPKQCAFCKGPHSPFTCTPFRAKTPQERQTWVKDSKRCFNCLGEHHLVSDCKVEKRCHDCNSKHHSLLHIPKPPPEANDCVTTSVGSQAGPPWTALIQVSSGRHKRYARALLDTGAEVTLISKSFATSLEARPLMKPPITIGGVGSAVSPYAVVLDLHGEESMQKGDESLHLEARVMPTIPQPTSTVSLTKTKSLPFLQNHPLADPEYMPGDVVDIILDNKSWQLSRTGEILAGPQRGLFADSTMFGWVVGGTPYSHEEDLACNPQILITKASDKHLDTLLETQWLNPEMPGDQSDLTMNAVQAEESFMSSYKRLEDGRCEGGMLRLPDAPELGESRSKAVQRCHSVERSLKKKGTWQDYKDAVLDFVESGHAEIVPEKDLLKPHRDCFYMPLHAVCKTTSTTTKIRPVCDASAPSSTGVSYNDTLASGPSLYHSLPSILVKFRDFAVAIVGDVSKMYRQISLSPSDRDFHRFVFNLTPSQLVDLRMTRVTFGVKSSPYVANRMLRQIAIEQKEQYPEAAQVISQSFYMDDVLTGASTVEKALQLRRDLNSVLATGRMPLCKWRSNSTDLLNSIPYELREQSDLTLTASSSNSQKTLGVHWASVLDDLHIATPDVQPSLSLTKRQLISAIARIFDPVGWFTPAVMTPRILAQEAWKLHQGWDEQLPKSILLPWQGWVAEMPVLTSHPIHRPYGLPGQSVAHRELHGFSDASERGYGGVVYLRTCYENGEVVMSLVISKARVAPIKELTIPRLELKGAVVLAYLLKQTAEDLQVAVSHTYAWTDSMICLGWLRRKQSQLAIYVGNRVSLIHSLVPDINWNHVPGRDNPADCLSRGLKPEDLVNYKLWWDGPSWLKSSPSAWPDCPDLSTLMLPEIKPKVSVVTVTPPDLSLPFTRFQHWVRITAWIRRFWLNLCHHHDRLSESFLTSVELIEARNCVLRASQRNSMPEELALIQAHRLLPKHHKLYPFSPYIDVDGLMKVGGRLEQLDLPHSVKHPVILNWKSHVVNMLVKSIHLKMLHPTMSAAMAAIAYQYYIPRLKPILKSICKKCTQCQRKWARPIHQRMGDLPAIRAELSHVFQNIGVDYAGPVFIFPGKGIKRVKTYIAVFVCLTTRAIHLELSADATTASFLAVLDRFCGRRGTPSRVWSDNGSNFRGAANELNDIMTSLYSNESKDTISRWSGDRGVKWRFQPAGSPHRGGLWEAGVRSMKGLIRKQLHDLHLTMDELNTLVISAESVLNSRPYLPLHATDPEGLCPLTPGHFLINRPLCALPQHVDVESKLCNIRHWELVKRIEYQNWTKFRQIFLPQLASRAKGMQKIQKIQVDDVVLLTNNSTRRNQWPLGIVTAVYPGPDGVVRTVDVKVETSGTRSAQLKTTIYKRAVEYLVRMPIDVT